MSAKFRPKRLRLKWVGGYVETLKLKVNSNAIVDSCSEWMVIQWAHGLGTSRARRIAKLVPMPGWTLPRRDIFATKINGGIVATSNPAALR